MNKIHFIFGIHNHQPVGNFDFVFEEAYQKSYLPLLDVLEKHPRIKMMFHTTGPLLDWLEENHPEYLERVRQLAEAGQFEIMSGGYYEPILAVLPDRDKSGQIRMMNEYVSSHFGQEPGGLWMAERIWEPHLPKTLSECDLRFITLDDYHFLSAGLDPETLTGYYRTDEQGYPISIFPISMRLRYLIPFGQPEEALDYLRSKADGSGENLLVMCDDGEKFGLWPGTYDWVIKKGWLDRFFTLLERAMDESWLNLTTCSAYAEEHRPKGRVYLPCASYFEMSEWSLPAQSSAVFSDIYHQLEKDGQIDKYRPFLKGGFWRNFLAKYSESNRMYRKALWISNLIAKLATDITSKQKNKLQALGQARAALFRAQCNCAYWHGVFGGLYLPHLRHAVYQNLLEAENLCNQIDQGKHRFTDVEVGDHDGDGSPEILLRNKLMGLLISPQEGGSVYEFDYLPGRFNLLNTLRRYPEGYHRKIAEAGSDVKEGASIHDQVITKEEGLADRLIYDDHPRSMLIDHFLSAEESPESLMNGSYYELGDFIHSKFQSEVRADGSENSVTLTCAGRVVDNTVQVTKKIGLVDDACQLKLSYSIENRSDFPLKIRFAPEFNFALLGGNAPDRYYSDDSRLKKNPLASVGISTKVRQFSLTSEADGFRISFAFEEPTEVWRYPVETVSQSEAGFEKVYQSSCVLPVYTLELPGGGKKEMSFTVSVEPLSD